MSYNNLISQHINSIDWFDGYFWIFGTMDGFSIVKWTVKIVSPSHDDVYCRLCVDFSDNRGKKIETSEQWKWYPNVYSKNRSTRMEGGFRYLLKGNTVQEMSGIVKTTYEEAGNISGIDFHILREML